MKDKDTFGFVVPDNHGEVPNRKEGISHILKDDERPVLRDMALQIR
jgi:hypothetical protein